MASASGQLRALNGLQSGSPRDLAIGIDTGKGEIDPATAAASPDPRQAGRRDDEGGPQRRGGDDSQTVVACAGCGRPLGPSLKQPRRIHAPLRVKERHPSERKVGDSSTSPFHMLSHDLPLLSRRYGRNLPLACGSSYTTHIMPNASAAWLAQSCSGPRSMRRFSSRLAW